MNNLNFGLYIEDILIRIMNGDEDSLYVTMYFHARKKRKRVCMVRDLFQISINLIFYRIHMDVTA